VVADTISRPSQPTLEETPTAATVSPAISTQLFPLPLSYTDIAKAEQTCQFISALQSLPSLNITAIPLLPQLSLLGDCAADFSLLNLPKGKSLGRSKPATNS
jgi:hypothetical protein